MMPVILQHLQILNNIILVSLTDSIESAIGQHNDARMNTCIALTAARYNATVANHIEVKKLLKKKQGDEELVALLMPEFFEILYRI